MGTPDYPRFAVVSGADLERGDLLRGCPRPRLPPPYREHLSQAFARLFMRVGLPADLPPFVKKR